MEQESYCAGRRCGRSRPSLGPLGRGGGGRISRGAGRRLEADSDWELPAVEREVERFVRSRFVVNAVGTNGCWMEVASSHTQAAAQPQCGGIPVWRCLLIGGILIAESSPLKVDD